MSTKISREIMWDFFSWKKMYKKKVKTAKNDDGDDDDFDGETFRDRTLTWKWSNKGDVE